jgi:hypothetical protein
LIPSLMQCSRIFLDVNSLPATPRIFSMSKYP